MKKKLIRYSLILLISGVLVGLDILTKIIFEGVNKTLIYDFLIIKSEHNYGAALGIFSGQLGWLIAISIIFLIVFFVFDYFMKEQSLLYFISFNLILAGAVGNLIDRIFLGYVRDFIFINVPFMPYFFNFADIYLTFGIVLLIISIFFKRNKKQSETIKTIEKKD